MGEFEGQHVIRRPYTEAGLRAKAEAAENPQAPEAGLRDVGGRLVEAVVAGTASARIEVLRRSSRTPIGWRFQQPSPTVFWFRSGIRSLRLEVDGRTYTAPVTSTGGLCFFPAHARIEGAFVVDAVADYTALFLDPLLVTDCGLSVPEQPVIGFAHAPMARSLYELSRDARHPDAVFELLVEGSALQSLAHLARLAEDVRRAEQAVPGLPGASLSRVERYVRDHLAEHLTVDDLAEVAGFSRRQFTRAFKQSVGQTPQRYVYSLRIDEAKRLLLASDEPVTGIATCCGFSHLQHFATAFRRATGMTPTQFRGRR
ncbi:AraC family transcriptional regulator [Streptomyces sp. NPDC052036]|uniref:AraC family transcriptional regulator n=1 Tax=unclassified Streptomyces TaxID=2593676 RepID=UPI003439B430